MVALSIVHISSMTKHHEMDETSMNSCKVFSLFNFYYTSTKILGYHGGMKVVGLSIGMN